MNQTRPAPPSVSQLSELHELWEPARGVATAADRLRSAIQQAKVARAEALRALRRAVLELGHDCPKERRDAVARVLYWRHPEVTVTDISVAFGYDQSTLLALVGCVQTSAACEDCGTGLIASSRSQLTELERIAVRGSTTRFGRHALCPHCAKRRDRVIFFDPPDELYDEDPEAWDDDQPLDW